MIDLLEHGGLHPQLDVAVDARAVFDAVAASDACDPQRCPLNLHLISVRDRLAQGIIRRMHWVDTRDMLADGLTKGGVDRPLLHTVSNGCRFTFDPHTGFSRLRYQTNRRRWGSFCVAGCKHLG